MVYPSKRAPILLFVLILLISGLRASAQDQDWARLSADARAAHQRGDFTESALLFNRVLSVQVKLLGQANPQVAATLNNLAVLYQDESLYTQAEPLYKQALAIWETTPGADAQVAGSLSNLAALYRDEHKDVEAEPLYNRALKLLDKIGRSESPEATAVLANLGDIYHSQGKDAEAEPLYGHA